MMTSWLTYDSIHLSDSDVCHDIMELFVDGKLRSKSVKSSVISGNTVIVMYDIGIIHHYRFVVKSYRKGVYFVTRYFGVCGMRFVI